MAVEAATSADPGPAGHVVRVRRDLLTACMTCPLCQKLINEATTISECLHTFCRKCIFEKLTDEEADCCPICNIDLGCVPVEKLRPDHNLQNVRAKIFPLKRRKLNAPEVPLISLPIRRKERLLSSLVVNTPRVGIRRRLTGRRTKAFARRAAGLHGLSHSIGESAKKEDGNFEGDTENSNKPETLSKIGKNRRQNSSNAGSSNMASNKGIENGEKYGDNYGLWKPLNCLVEAANRKAPFIKSEKINGLDVEVHISKTNIREHPNKSRIQDEENGSCPNSPGLVKSRRSRGIIRKRKELAISAQALVDAAGGKREKSTSPIWVSLVASTDRDGDAPLPQLSSTYLRIKDGNLPASFIQKYVVKKLGLASETEVEINCQGQVVDLTMPLHGLVDMCPQKSSNKTHALVGSTAMDFVMVLTYCRRATTVP